MIQRIIQLRKEKGLSQEEFAEKLRLSRNFINQVETGKKNYSKRTIEDICDVFGVRIEWLRDGVEPREAPTKEDESLEALLGQSEITDRDRSLVKVFLKLDPAARAEVIRFVEECAREFSPPAADQPSAVSDVASRLAALESQLATEKARADRAEAEAREAKAEAKARTDELLEIYREEGTATAEGRKELPMEQSERSSSHSR